MKRSWSTLILLLVAEASCAHAPPVSGRYLYEVMCAAEVARFDTVERTKTGEYDLAKQPSAAGLIPVSEGVLEGCLVVDTMFEPNASVFHTVVRTSWQLNELLSHRLLTFSVPELALVKQEPAGTELEFEFEPELEVEQGRVRVAPPGKPLSTYLDVSDFAPGHRDIPNRVLESSDKRILLELSAEPVGNYAVADRETKTVVRLLHTPSTDNNSVHLSPGAVIVLVEETAPGSPLPRKTGQLVVYDARTGAPIKTFEDPRIDGTFYRGMAPTGIALYQNMERTVFVDLGMTFPAEAVVVARRPDFVGPAVFFSDR